jgi:hypothetical protein
MAGTPTAKKKAGPPDMAGTPTSKKKAGPPDMAGTPTSKKKAGPPDGDQAPMKRIKRSDTTITPEEVADFLPKPAVEYVKDSKVSTHRCSLPVLNSY